MTDIYNLRSAAVMIAGVLVLWAGLGTAQSKAAPPDSGVFGVVPHYAEDLAFLEQDIDSAKKQLASQTDSQLIGWLNSLITEKQASIENMRNRCVEAFDPTSELPLAYSSFGEPLVIGLGTFAPCRDPRPVARDFTKLLATAPCGSHGSFRLPLEPGRYAVFVGWPLAGHSHSFRPDPWWEFVEVRPHEWKDLVPRKDNVSPDLGCEDDSDCSNGLVCRTKLPEGTKSCQRRRRLLPPNYDSGVRGAVSSEVCAPYKFQCVEAFREHSDYMATCGWCSELASAFEIPLAPGRYTLRFESFTSKHQTVTVEIAPNEWKELYVLGAKPGQIPPECLNPNPGR